MDISFYVFLEAVQLERDAVREATKAARLAIRTRVVSETERLHAALMADPDLPPEARDKADFALKVARGQLSKVDGTDTLAEWRERKRRREARGYPASRRPMADTPEGGT